MKRISCAVVFFAAVGTVLPVFASQKRTGDGLDRSTSSKRTRKLSLQEIAQRQTRLNQQLFQAIENDNVAAIPTLQGLGADIDAEVTDRHGDRHRTALHWAVDLGCTAAVRMLKRHGANLEIPDHTNAIEGATPLLDAVGRGHTEMVRILLQLGANRSVRSTEGWTPLHVATICNQMHLMRFFASPATIEAMDNEGWTSLHLAAYAVNKEGVLFLLRSGANVRAIDYLGNTPIHKLLKSEDINDTVVGPAFGTFDDSRAARARNNVERAKELIDNLLAHEKRHYHGEIKNLNQRDFEGETPLHIVSKRGWHSLVDFLVNRGANQKLKTVLGEKYSDLLIDEVLDKQSYRQSVMRRKCRNQVLNYLIDEHELPVALANLQLKFLGTFEPRSIDTTC